MRTPAQAVADALYNVRAGTYYGVGKCDHVVAGDYGLAYSGFYTALDHALAVPIRYRHGWSTGPPPGALVFWAGGSSGAGHVALSVGGGLIATTDYLRAGKVDVVALWVISTNWGLRSLYWTDAWYGSQGVQIVSTVPSTLPMVAPGKYIATAHTLPQWPVDVSPIAATEATRQWSGHQWRNVSLIDSAGPRWQPDILGVEGLTRQWSGRAWGYA